MTFVRTVHVYDSSVGAFSRVAERLADVVSRLSEREDSPEVFLVVDATGVGRPIVDLLREAVGQTARLTAVTFTATDRLEDGIGSWEARVGQGFLVSRLQSLLQRDRIKMPPTPEARALAEELRTFEMRASDRGIKAEARAGGHDDLVMALGLAVLDDPGRYRARSAPSPW